MSNSRYIESFCEDNNLYKTRKGIMGAEKRDKGKINWDVFDRLVKELKENFKAMRIEKELRKEQERKEKEVQELNDIFKTKHMEKEQSKAYKCAVYKNGELVGEYDTWQEASLAMGFNKNTASRYLNRTGGIYAKENIVFKKNYYTVANKPKHIYVYNTKGEQIDHFDNTLDFVSKYKMSERTLRGYVNSKQLYKSELIFSFAVVNDFSPYLNLKTNACIKSKKKVYAYNIVNGEFLGEYDSSVAASRAFGLEDRAVSSAINLRYGIFKNRRLKFSYTKI